MSNFDLSELAIKYDVLGNEYQICRHKLESKNEALLILSKELDECRSERDQFKLMAEQLQERCQGMKRQLAGNSVPSLSFNQVDPGFYSDMQSQIQADSKCSPACPQVDWATGSLLNLIAQAVPPSPTPTPFPVTDEGNRPRPVPATDRRTLQQLVLNVYVKPFGLGLGLSLVNMLCETKEHNKSLKFEVDDLKQKLHDAQGDIKLLREQIARQRVGTTDEGINTRHFPAYEREDLVKQLEAARKEYAQLERDLQQVLDEKQDQEMERDGYKIKYDRLNQELNYILKGDENRIVDIDALAMENKYLQERLKQLEEEKAMAMQTASKYKSMLEKKKNKGILKLGQSRSGGLVITQKQGGHNQGIWPVQQMLESRTGLPVSQQAMADLQGLCSALLDTINDKTLALSHQRKTNKILGNRISELEKKLKTFEVSGLWNVPAHAPYLAKLQAECAEMKMLVPRQMSQSSDTSDKTRDLESDISSITSPDTSPTHRQHTPTPNTPSVGMDDLDLLPTKEDSGKKVEATHTENFQHQTSDNMSHMNYNIQCYPENGDAGDDNTDTDNNDSDRYGRLEKKESITDFIEDVTAKIQNFPTQLQSESGSFCDGEMVDGKDDTEVVDSAETDSLLLKHGNLDNQDKQEVEVDNSHSEFPPDDEPLLLNESENLDSNC